MYSSTTLKGPSESGCWKQLDYAEQNADSLFRLMYRSDLGVAAHAVLQYCVERNTETEDQIRKTGEDVGDLLIKQGRTFRDRLEGCLPADDVWQGVDVAVSYLLAKGLPLEADALYPERDWTHPTLPYRAQIDLVAVYDEGDEEYQQRVCEVTDYKSSWQADKDELNTLQRWGQAVCVWPWTKQFHESPPDIIRQRVVNLRTWAEYTRDIHLDDPDDVAELEKWEGRIKELCETADSMKQFQHKHAVGVGISGEGHSVITDAIEVRPANPGVGCLSCQYRHICPDAQHATIPGFSLDEAATELAVIEGQRALIISALKESDPEGAIPINGGYVGYKAQSRRVIQPGAEKAILDDWLAMFGDDLPQEFLPILQSLIKAFKLGKGNLDAFAKALYPESKKGIGEIRDEYVANITDEMQYGQFGVWKDD